MCGIVGIIGKRPVAAELIEGLRRLEYRGYDSAGVATLIDGRIERRRAEGKLGNLAARLEREPVHGTIGIGHTRWATHGLPTEDNAHPIATDRVAVVHNGIIENFQELKRELTGLGPSLPHADRHRGGRDPDDPSSGAGHDPGAGGGAHPGAARRRVRARLPVRRRARSVDLRPARQPAGDRLWRRRDVYRLGFAGAGAADPAASPISKKATGPS